MKVIKTSALVALFLSMAAFAAPGQNSITGDWYGTLNVQNIIKLRLVFHISETDGKLAALIDSPDQNSYGIPAGDVVFEAPNLSVKMPLLQAEYLATANSDLSELSGTFTQRNMELPLTLGRQVVEKEVVHRPQEPKPPFPYREEEVFFKNSEAGITLAGTLTLPNEKGKFPVVVLVSGSGPQDRNEEMLDHKPFLVIADYLTRQGIGVLRYDDRGVGQSGGNFATATTRDFAGDALAAVRYLKTRPDMKKKKIGIVGHSEGGMIAPIVAAKTKEVNFIVLLAGTGLRGAELLLTQQELIARAEGASEQEIAISQKHNKQIFDLILSESDTVKLRKEIAPLLLSLYDELSEADKKAASSKGQFLIASQNLYLSPWMFYFLRYDPAVNLKKLKCPVLALNGEKDLQVDPKSNLEAIRSSLKKAKNKHFTIEELPGLNHLFQTAKTGSPSEYHSIEETFSPTALKLIADWILKNG